MASINTIKISGGEFDWNLFPGQITGVTVEIHGQAVAVTTTPTGFVKFLGIAVDDLVSLAGTPLAGVRTDTVVLRDFVFGAITFNQFTMKSPSTASPRCLRRW